MPLSNCEVGGGFAPIPELLKAGVEVALGTDGYINDFFTVMKAAFYYTRLVRRTHLLCQLIQYLEWLLSMELRHWDGMILED